MRACLSMRPGDDVSRESLLAALVAGLPARQRAKALRRRGEDGAVPAVPVGAADAGLTHETGHMWHGREASCRSAAWSMRAHPLSDCLTVSS